MANFVSNAGPPGNGFATADFWVQGQQPYRFTSGAWAAVGRPGDTAVALTPGSNVVLDPTLGKVFTLTPGETESITATPAPPVGYEITLIVLTSGTSSFTLTFSTGFKTTGTLATGTSDARTFIMKFIARGDGTLIEVSRTAAIT